MGDHIIHPVPDHTTHPDHVTHPDEPGREPDLHEPDHIDPGHPTDARGPDVAEPGNPGPDP